jgi:hypothetical protein
MREVVPVASQLSRCSWVQVASVSRIALMRIMNRDDKGRQRHIPPVMLLPAGMPTTATVMPVRLPKLALAVPRSISPAGQSAAVVRRWPGQRRQIRQAGHQVAVRHRVEHTRNPGAAEQPRSRHLLGSSRGVGIRLVRDGQQPAGAAEPARRLRQWITALDDRSRR